MIDRLKDLFIGGDRVISDQVAYNGEGYYIEISADYEDDGDIIYLVECTCDGVSTFGNFNKDMIEIGIRVLIKKNNEERAKNS